VQDAPALRLERFRAAQIDSLRFIELTGANGDEVEVLIRPLPKP